MCHWHDLSHIVKYMCSQRWRIVELHVLFYGTMLCLVDWRTRCSQRNMLVAQWLFIVYICCLSFASLMCCLQSNHMTTHFIMMVPVVYTSCKHRSPTISMCLLDSLYMKCWTVLPCIVLLRLVTRSVPGPEFALILLSATFLRTIWIFLWLSQIWPKSYLIAAAIILNRNHLIIVFIKR